MANAYSTKDLLKGALQCAGEVTDGSSRYNELALVYLNEIYHAILGGPNEFKLDNTTAWTWARTPATLILLPPYTTGSVTLTNGSVSGVFSQAPTTSQANCWLKVTNLPTYYQISAHTAGQTNFTLEASYQDAGGAGLGFTSIPLSYDLGANILRLCDPLRIDVDRCLEDLETDDDEAFIYAMNIDSFRRRYPLRNLVNDVPSKFATYLQNETNWFILVNKYVSAATKVNYDIIKIQPDLEDSDTSIPLLPRAYRKVLKYGAAALLHQDKRDKESSALYWAKTTAVLEAMKLSDVQNEINSSISFGRIVPRADSRRTRFRP